MKFFVTAHAAKGTFLQESQELHLSLHRKVANFVEEKRSPVGSFGTTDTAIHSTRKGSLFVTEKFAFHQVFRQSRAVQRNERFVLSFRQIHNCTGNHFLTRTATATNQNRCIARGHLAHLFVNLLHFAAVTHQFAGVVRKHVTKLTVFFEHGFVFVMQFNAFVSGITRDVCNDFKQSHIAV